MRSVCGPVWWLHGGQVIAGSHKRDVVWNPANATYNQSGNTRFGDMSAENKALFVELTGRASRGRLCH
jgi:hypothetical protein